jgi:hydroxymethylpyrimidine/phosphomethylpyrimidine kinase
MQALKYGLPLGHGTGPVNPYAPFARDLARPGVLAALQAGAARLQAEGFETLIPEVGSNLGYAAPYPEGPRDVAAFPGRLRPGPQGLLIPAPPAFGASRHIAAVILTAMTCDPELRSALNVKFFDGIDDLAPLLHLRAVAFDCGAAPPEAKGDGVPAWGVASVLKPGERPPDLIYDRGGLGREPMIRILGPTPMHVAEKALALKTALSVADRR